MSTLYYYDGHFYDEDPAKVSLEDRGHEFGDGVYEVVRVYGGRPFLLEWHLERFERSCSAIGLHNPLSREDWIRLIHEAVRRSHESEAQVYWQLTRGAAPRVHWFPGSDSKVTLIVRAQTAAAPTGGATLLAYPDERWAHVFVKTINLLPNVLAKESAHRAGADEALLVRGGVITEGAGSNAWFVSDGKLYTHPADRHILPGITRRLVLQLAQSLGIPTLERAVTLSELRNVEEVFMTGTTTEILPVQKIIAESSRLTQLSELEDAPPESLLYECVNPVELWAQTGEAPLTERLRAAFADAVAHCRNQSPMNP
ncbi:aminotransferase class IV [Alicyclobacillus kakegawensis]|uniref:aminotransferase class IV n=1 Tax=Alicyclobacillus kakegawensis TaxID=392012 RepID=UPI0008318F99|nr:aminotransferase class IV [Alicyclobacillus kakegawensis]